MTENFDFRGHLSTLRAETTTKSRPFKVEKNAPTLPKQPQNNFEKVQKTAFSTAKLPKHGCQIGQMCRFLVPFSRYELYFCLAGTKNFKNIVPPNS